MKRTIVMLLVALSAYGALPAHAASHLYGTGAITAGCGGGSLAMEASNVSGDQWTFTVTAVCTNATPRTVVTNGTWKAATGGDVVTSLPLGGLTIGPVSCGANANVNVEIRALLSPLTKAKATITRIC